MKQASIRQQRAVSLTMTTFDLPATPSPRVSLGTSGGDENPFMAFVNASRTMPSSYATRADTLIVPGGYIPSATQVPSMKPEQYPHTFDADERMFAYGDRDVATPPHSVMDESLAYLYYPVEDPGTDTDGEDEDDVVDDLTPVYAGPPSLAPASMLPVAELPSTAAQYDNVIAVSWQAPMLVTLPLDVLRGAPTISVNGPSPTYARGDAMRYLLDTVQRDAAGLPPLPGVPVAAEQARNLLALLATGYEYLFVRPDLTAAFAIQDPNIPVGAVAARMALADFAYADMAPEAQHRFMLHMFNDYITELAMRVGYEFRPLLALAVARRVWQLAQTIDGASIPPMMPISLASPMGMSGEAFVDALSPLPPAVLRRVARAIPIDGPQTLFVAQAAQPCRFRYVVREDDLLRGEPMAPPLAHALGPTTWQHVTGTLTPGEGLHAVSCLRFVRSASMRVPSQPVYIEELNAPTSPGGGDAIMDSDDNDG